MKKFKKIFTFVVCVLCVCLTFAFAGCNDKSFVKGSFEYSISSYSYINKYDVYGKFKIKTAKNGKYKVSYTLRTEGVCGQQKVTQDTTVSVVDGKETDVNVFATFNMVNGNSNNNAYISNVRISPMEKDMGNTPYAIGFGATGGALLIAAVTVFVLDKCGVFKKKN